MKRNRKPVFETQSSGVARLFDEHQPKILMIDGEEAVREVLRDLLESEGCSRPSAMEMTLPRKATKPVASHRGLEKSGQKAA